MILTIAPGTSPALVPLVNKLVASVDRFNKRRKDGPELHEVCGEVFAKVEAFTPRSIADVLTKAHAGGAYYGEGIPKGEDDCLYAADRILLQMITDLDHLAAAKVTASAPRSSTSLALASAPTSWRPNCINSGLIWSAWPSAYLAALFDMTTRGSMQWSLSSPRPSKSGTPASERLWTMSRRPIEEPGEPGRRFQMGSPPDGRPDFLIKLAPPARRGFLLHMPVAGTA